jgi:hypothetical protein
MVWSLKPVTSPENPLNFDRQYRPNRYIGRLSRQRISLNILRFLPSIGADAPAASSEFRSHLTIACRGKYYASNYCWSKYGGIVLHAGIAGSR